VSTPRDAAATKQRILEQARQHFVRRGFKATTVKGVADAAGVSPNLITRYFGGKDGLFLASTQVSIPVQDALAGDLASLGARLAARIVRRWSAPPEDDPLLILQRASGERPEAAEALASFLDANSLEPLIEHLRSLGLDASTAHERASAIDAFVLGVSTRRRVLRADLDDPAKIEAWLGAAIQRLADG
jgi:AcrR family transcriptional regulator